MRQAMRQPPAVLSPQEDVTTALDHVKDGPFDAWPVADADGSVGHGSKS